jgi:hypothetical protein
MHAPGLSAADLTQIDPRGRQPPQQHDEICCVPSQDKSGVRLLRKDRRGLYTMRMIASD